MHTEVSNLITRAFVKLQINLLIYIQWCNEQHEGFWGFVHFYL